MSDIRDGNWTLFSHDAEMGRTIWETQATDRRGNPITVYRIDYDVTNLLNENLEEYNNAQRGWKGDWHKVASVPHNILHGSGFEKAMEQRDDKWVKRWLNDLDNKKWRTKPGTI